MIMETLHFTVSKNEIQFIRNGEVVRLSACGENCIRFQATANRAISEQNWTLTPQNQNAKAYIENDCAVLETGKLKAVLQTDGKATYYSNGRKILEEKYELTFNQGIRNYRNNVSGKWRARVTFCPNDNEHFYGLGHEPTGCFDLKGCSVDLRH